VIAVNRDGVCHQIPDHRLSTVEKERINWWSPRLLEVVTARYAILVEGLTDRIIVERCAELAGIALDRIGAVVVFDIDGANKFPHVYRILGADGFDVPLLGLVDEKEQGVWLGAIGGKAPPTAAPVHGSTPACSICRTTGRKWELNKAWYAANGILSHMRRRRAERRPHVDRRPERR
jgi:hypothetical protein